LKTYELADVHATNRLDVHAANTVIPPLMPGKPAIARTVGVTEASPDPGNREIVLGLLTSIERDSAVTQRKLAGDLGIALGLANAYLRRCVRKGLVKMRQVPFNRYAYYLTPQGFAEKSRLTAEYLSVSLDFFRRARGDCADLLRDCTAQKWRRVALYGAGDLAEIAILSAGESTIEIICVVDAELAGRRCAGLAVVADLAAAQACAAPQLLDGVILTDTRTPQASFERLCSIAVEIGLMPGAIAAPRLLGISLTPADAADAAEAGAPI
jgi:DNA-binding MarR family transcriptional regulator